MSSKSLHELSGTFVYQDPLAEKVSFSREPDTGLAKFGVFFECPLCPGGHGIIAAFRANTIVPHPIWKVENENSLDNITLTPSINCQPSCLFHGWITKGQVVW